MRKAPPERTLGMFVPAIAASVYPKTLKKVLTKYEQYVNIYLYTHANVNKLLTKVRNTSKDLLEARYGNE